MSMLSPGVLTLIAPSAAAVGEAGAGRGPAHFPPGSLDAIAGWLAEDDVAAGVPRNATVLLDVLRGAPALAPLAAEGGWQAYFAALGLEPTAAEARQIHRFQALHPHVAREIEALAAEVARAQRLRDEAFSALTDDQWALLPDAVVLVSSGQAASLTDAHLAALAAIDLRPLVDAASAMSHAAATAPARLERAQELDAQLDASIPAVLRDPAAHEDPAALVRAAAGGVAPVATTLTLEQAVTGLSLLTDVSPEEGIANLRLLPADLQAPLAAILVAHSRELAQTSPDAGLATLATIGENLPALTRAAYNLSLGSHGFNAMRLNQPRPLEALSAQGLIQPLVVLQDLYGEGAKPPQAGLVEGLTRLHQALGVPLPQERIAQARQLETAYGPGFSNALGSLLAAQAEYEETVARVEAAGFPAVREVVATILDSSGPLTRDQIRFLQESAAMEEDLRRAVGRASFGLAYAILDLPGAEPPRTTAGPGQGDNQDLGVVLILDDKSSLVDRDRFPNTYAAVIDLGGDDTYRIPLGGVGPGFPYAAAVAIDLGGNDAYQAVADASFGAAVGTGATAPAFAFLLDAQGDDTYRGGKHSLGYASDGIGIFVDLIGDDRYDATAGEGLAHARTSSIASSAAAVFVDVLGNDVYNAREGIARLDDSSSSTATSAVFLEVGGADTYTTACPRDPAVACFGKPRPGNKSVPSMGSVVFIDVYGDNTYPRRVDPITTSENATDTSREQYEYYDNVTWTYMVDPNAPLVPDGLTEGPVPAVDATRYAFVSDSKGTVQDVDAEVDYLVMRLDDYIRNYTALGMRPGMLYNGTLDSRTVITNPINGGTILVIEPINPERIIRGIDLYEMVRDEDGDLIPSIVERAAREGSEKEPVKPGSQDSDSDGFFDFVEALLGTSAQDASDYPAGLPLLPDPAPTLPPYQGPANFVLNIPGVVAIGGPGTTRYHHDYRLAIDLGTTGAGSAGSGNDLYRYPAAANGHVIDLGGNDEYAVPHRGAEVPPALAAVTGKSGLSADPSKVDTNSPDKAVKGIRFVDVASLIDLGGDDRYRAKGASLASVHDVPGVALFLDAAGADAYQAPDGRSQGYAGVLGGRAYFLDLGGNDVHAAPSQGVANARFKENAHITDVVGRNSAFSATGALFIDAGGRDTYDATATALRGSEWDTNQGSIEGVDDALGGNLLSDGGGTLGSRSAATLPSAVFMDLADDDVYLQSRGPGLREDVKKDGRFRANPLDDDALWEVAVFLDTHLFSGQSQGLRDGDRDGHADAAEDILGTGSGDDGDEPVDDEGDLLLKLPRLGLAVGSSNINEYPAGIDYALQVDLGGSDVYRNRAGASSPRFPVSLLVDVGGDDTYTSNATALLGDYSTFRLADTMIRAPYAAAQGAGILGVGVLRDEGGRNSFTVRPRAECSPAPCSTYLFGASQGAGVLGVGVLSTGDSLGSDFLVEAISVARDGRARAFTQSQGAGVLGMGLLVSEDPRAPDRYALRASAFGRSPQDSYNTTSGQAYALQGVGMLLDAGGNNRFEAQNLAQGAAEATVTGDADSRTWSSISLLFGTGVSFGGAGAGSPSPFGPPSFQPPVMSPSNQPVAGGLFGSANGLYPESSMAQLLLPGVGDDLFLSSGRSQAFADGIGSSALLFDAEGNDVRMLNRTDGSVMTLGQGAGVRGGTGLLLDNRGNDRNLAPGAFGVQGYGGTGQGMLVDLGGADEYFAFGDAQGSVGTMGVHLSVGDGGAGFYHPGFALFLERGGNDLYTIQDGSKFSNPVSAWGGAFFDASGGNRPAAATSIFIETAGNDLYTGSPRNRVVFAGGNPQTESGNNWRWTVTGTGSSTYAAYGVDTESPSLVHDLLHQTGASIVEPDPECNPCKGVVSLQFYLGSRDAQVMSAGLSAEGGLAGTYRQNASLVDRVEFYAGARFLGLGRENRTSATETPAPARASVNKGSFDVDFDTNQTDVDGLPVFPDGVHTVTALLYPRVGTPDVDSRRAAVDGEPIRAWTEINVDNPPIPRKPELDQAVVSTLGDVSMRLRVDRDLERCATLGCADLRADIAPGPSEWYLPEMNRTATPALDSCTSTCRVTIRQAVSAGGKAYLTWTPPGGVTPQGYWIFREGPGTGGPQMAGYVDARVQPKNVTDDGVPVYWFVDKNPGSANKYWVYTLFLNGAGELVYSRIDRTFSLNSAPDLVTGLRAVGVEGRVKLAWNEAPGASSYKVYRKSSFENNGNWQEVASGIREPRHQDASGLVPDRVYSYSVKAVGPTGQLSPLHTLPAQARPSPGHEVTITLLRNDTWEHVATVLPPTELGGLWTHNHAWDGKDERGDKVPDGEYLLHVTYRDGRHADAGERYDRVKLDGTPPRTTVLLPGNAGGPHLAGSSLRIPFQTEETGSGVRQTAFFIKAGDQPWPTTPIVVPGGVGSVTYSGVTDGRRLSIIALSEDNAGNIEGLVSSPAWKPTFVDAFADALARGAFTVHVLDISPPSVVVGERPVFHVQPNGSVEFTVNAVDYGTGIAGAVAEIRGENVPMFPIGDGKYRGKWKAHGEDGRIQVIFRITDRAGNVAQVRGGEVVVDATPPTVASALVAFPGGRVVGRPGEVATLQVSAQDAYAFPGELNLTLESRNASSVETAYFRFDADARIYSATFPVNRMQAKEANVTLRVRDLAGNLVTLPLVVHVNNTVTALTPPVLAVGPDRILVNWTTLDPVRSRVDYGSSAQMGQSTPLGPLGTTHSVLVAGLKPDTEYYLKAVGVTDSGLENGSDIIVVRTGAALNLTLVALEGAPYSQGKTRLGVEARRYDGATPTMDLEAVLLAPRGAPRIVGTATGVVGSGAVDLDLAEVRDGSYSVLLRAREGDFTGQSAAHVLVVDRAAPLLSLPDVRAATKGATYTVGVEERGSGVDVSAVSWTFGSRQCSAILTGNDTLSCVVPDLNLDADVEMRLHVPDRAGNVAAITARLAVDSAAPVVGNHTLGGVDGSAHLRPGARGRIVADVQDHGVKKVTADLTAFAAGVVELRHVRDTRYEATFDVPAAAPEGPVAVRVTAVDAAGQKTVVDVSSAVDATPPVLLRSSLLPQGPGEVMVALQIDEPARATVKAAGPLGEIHAASASADITQLITLKGFRAGAPLRAVVTITDLAGIEVTTVIEGKPLADAKPPTKVPALRLEDRGDGRILLRWDAATDDEGVAGYRVIRTLAGRAPVTLPLVSGLMLTDEVPLDVRVTYTVAAVDFGGNAGEVATAEGVSLAVPRLSNGTVDPPLGGPGLFTFAVDLVAAGGGAPEVVVRVNGVNHPMTPDKADCREGCRYTAVVAVGAETLAAGPHEYSFHVVSGAFRVAYPEIDALVGPTVLQGEEPPLLGVLAAANQVPAGGLLLGALAVAAAVGALVWIRRRKA